MNKVKKCRYGKMIYNTKDKYVGWGGLGRYGEYSQYEVDFLLKIVNKESWIVEVGSNLGAILIPLSLHSSYVIGIEPQEFIYYTLCGNVAINNLQNVKLFQRAVGEKTGEIVFMPKIDYTKQGNFGGISCSLTNDGSKYPVVTLALDDLQLPRCDLIKADVEGNELSVLKGASKILQQFKPNIYVEGDRQEKLRDLINYITNVLGYKYYMHVPPLFNENNFAGNKRDYLRLKGKPLASFNIFAFHPDKDPQIDDPFLVNEKNMPNLKHN